MKKPAALSVEQYLRALAPQCVADGGYEVFINMAEQRTNRPFYGLKANQAVALLAAHIWFLLGSGNGGAGSGSAEGGVTGSIASKREGDLAIGYGSGAASGATSPDEAELALTRWGLMLLNLRKGCKPFIGVCGEGVCPRPHP